VKNNIRIVELILKKLLRCPLLLREHFGAHETLMAIRQFIISRINYS